MEVPTRTQCPPEIRTMRFCLKCGRHDGLGGTLARGHWAVGKLCGGECVIVRYALVDCERSRLEREVIEKAKEWHDSRLDQVGDKVAHSERLFAAVVALRKFESNQQQVKK